MKENPFSLIDQKLSQVASQNEQILNWMQRYGQQTPAEPDELLTPEETAQLLKVSKVTVWDWSKRGILKKHTIGNQVRYLRSEVLTAATGKRA